MTIENVPSFALGLDRSVEVPGYGRIDYDLAFGGNFYAIVDLDAIGEPFDRGRQQQIADAGLAIMAAINATEEPVHPEAPEIAGCHHV